MPIWARLGEFAAPDGGGNLVFRHALLRDSAYDGLSYRLRRQLHARAGEAIRIAAGDTPEEHAELLSLHYLQAQEYHEAWTYSLVAAERARAVYANIEAAGFFERALAGVAPVARADRRAGGRCARGVGRRPRPQRGIPDGGGPVPRLLGACGGTTRWPRPVSCSSCRGSRVGSTAIPTPCAGSRGRLRRLEGDRQRRGPTATGPAAGLVRAVLPGAGPPPARHHVVPRAPSSRPSWPTRRTPWPTPWRSWTGRRWSWARSSNPPTGRGAWRSWRSSATFRARAGCSNSLGIFAYFRGQWDEALVLYGQAQQMARRVGNAVHLAIYEGNMAEIALDQGRTDEAERLFESVARTCRAAGHRSGEAHVTGSLARAAARSGRYEDADRLFEKARQHAEELGGQAESLEVGARWAECRLLAGDVDDALVRADIELARARALGGVPPQMPLLHRVRGVALAREGDALGAAEALGLSLEAARLLKADYEAALTMGVMAALGLEDHEHGPDELARESARILEALGVVSVPDLLAR